VLIGSFQSTKVGPFAGADTRDEKRHRVPAAEGVSGTAAQDQERHSQRCMPH
jgi:putative methionine-R-sulfoxide reductase with GAF domain